MKKLLLFFMSIFSVLGYSQFPEGFEGATFPPTGWIRFDNGIGLAQQWSETTNASLVHSGAKAAFLNRENVTDGTQAIDWLVAPQVLVPANGQLRFYTKKTQNGNFGSIYTIRVSTASQNISTDFVTIQTWTEANLVTTYNVYEQKLVDLSAYAGQNIHIAFVMENDNGDRWLVDDVKVDSACQIINTDPSATTLATSATLSWTSPNPTGPWEIEYGPAGFVQGTGTKITVTDNLHTITGLTPLTSYCFYVRTLCDSDNPGPWTVACTNFQTISACPKPINLLAQNIAQTSAELSWTEVGSATQWIIEYGPAGFALGTGTTVNVNTPLPYLLSSLTSGTAYQYYVKSNCGSVDGLSEWSDSFMFATSITNDDCDAAKVILTNPNLSCNNFASGVLFGATASSEPNSCFGTADDDVWFEFVATSTSHTVSANIVSGSSLFDPLVGVIYEGGACSSMNQIFCDLLNSPATVDGLTIGNTYKIRVYSILENPNSNVAFNICITTKPLLLDNTTYTVPELVTDMLINSPCSQVSNITWSTGNTNGNTGTNGIAYFQDMSGTMPFSKGIVLTTGDAMQSSGPNTYDLEDGGEDWDGDAQLFNYMQDLGIDPDLETYKNATIIEFDFVPLASNFSFNFMFASEEYGGFQCNFSDAFAFFLTDTSTGTTTNLAVVPGTTTPISVITVRDNLYNEDCDSVNPEYFDVFNLEPNDPNLATTNYNGQTVQLTAQSSVTPLNTYHIKLVIADRNDSILDSAVFLQEGSFNIGNIDLGNDFLESNGTAICSNGSVLLESGLNSTTNTTFQWKKNDVDIPGETSPNLLVTSEGVYTLNVSFTGSTCALSDSITVEFYDPFVIAVPNDLNVLCNSSGFATFDLTDNESFILNGLSATEYTFTYYESLVNAQTLTNSISNVTTYQNIVQYEQPIYISILNTVTGCREITQFDLLVKDSLPATFNPLSFCEGSTGSLPTTSIENFTGNWGGATIDTSTPGVFTFTFNPDAGQCAASGTITVTITAAPAATFNSLTFCQGSTGSLPTVSIEGFTGTWELGGVAVSTIDTSVLGNYTYNFIPTTGQCASVGTLAVVIDSKKAVTFDDANTCLGSQIAFPTMSIEGYQLQGIWTPSVVNNTISGATTYTFIPNDVCYGQGNFLVTLSSCTIPKGFSPNGDGNNDTWDLSAFDIKKVEVYNRYGLKVYSKTSYINEWGGKSDNGNDLPTGTYYFMVEFNDRPSETGWVYINRGE